MKQDNDINVVESKQTRIKKHIILISPFLIIGINHLVAKIGGQIIGKWTFIPIILVCWSLMTFFILWGGGKKSISSWLKKPTGSIGWTFFAISISLLTLPLFLMHWQTLKPLYILLPWLIIAIINPFIEEFYWRGLLMDNTKKWLPFWSILFSSFVFAMNHPLAFGVNSELNSGFTVLVSTFIMGIIWGTVYYKTKSLRFVIVAHFFVDIFNLSVPAFLDLFSASW